MLKSFRVRVMIGAFALAAAVSNVHSTALAADAWNQSLVGKYSCTMTTPRGTLSFTKTATTLGDQWIRFDDTIPAQIGRPAVTAGGLAGYDIKQHQWVTLYYDSLGTYSVAKSSAAPDAMTQTYVDAYPVDPSDGPTVLTWGKNRITADWSIAMQSQKIPLHMLCVKQ